MLAENLENWAQQERQEERRKVLHETEQRVRQAGRRTLEEKHDTAIKTLENMGILDRRR